MDNVTVAVKTMLVIAGGIVSLSGIILYRDAIKAKKKGKKRK